MNDSLIKYDYILAGGGLSGLMMALELQKFISEDARVLIIDKNAKIQNDRTWSFWSVDRFWADNLAVKTWENIHVRGAGFDKKMKRIDNGTPGKLHGAWLMSGRVKDGKTQLRNTDQPRKTMKILSGTRFQWIAYNTETKQFMGTGGGTYTTIDGKYTESIEFFSRDDSKAGLSLKFDYSLVNGKWHHKGFSSKGDALHEIWGMRE